MGDGTMDGVQTPPQEGVIVRDGENFPMIPEYLLKLSPDELQRKIDKTVRTLGLNRDSILPDLKLEERLENYQFICESAKIAVERQRASVER